MEQIRVRAPSLAHANRLLVALDGTFPVRMDGDGDGDGQVDGTPAEVALMLDSETAKKLVELFNTLGEWLTDSGLDAAQIGFGERTYTLLAADGETRADPTGFLLERTIQLQTALDSRIVIEQAKGILAERESIDPEAAFQQMRRQARSRRMKLRDLAQGIVATVDGARR
ncbi:MAG: ANTAR domain-containing response regulator [Gaiellaceae bacterium]